MGEILFRGKTKDNVWYHGFIKGKSLPNFEGNKLEFTPCIIEQPHADIWVIPETVGQYTGLTDKNGKKIFEGDIIASALWWQEKPQNGVVDFRDGSFGLLWYRGEAEQFNPFTSMCNITYEVIGNIHDNPELLKGGVQE